MAKERPNYGLFTCFILVITTLLIAGNTGCGGSGAVPSGKTFSQNVVPPPASTADTIAPLSIDFGNVVVGGSKSITTTVTNTGTTSITVSQVVITGSGYVLDTNLPVTIVAGASATLSIRFSPQGAGTIPGTAAVTTNASSTAVNVSLTGVGIAANAQIQVTPSVAFGNVTVGNTGTSSITLMNVGSSIIHVSAVTVSGAGFASTATLPITIPIGGSTPVPLTFTPSSTGNLTGTISVVSDTANSPSVVSLAGTGFQISVSPATATMAIVWGKQFQASVLGPSNTAVTWTVNGITGGNNTLGNITASGFYTAPAAPVSVNVIATSVADPTKSASAAVTIQQTLQPPQFANLITCHDDGTPNGTCLVTPSPADPLPPLFDPNLPSTIYTDPVFHTHVKRVSIPPVALTLPTGSTLPFMVPNYAPNQAWNADGSKLILFANDGHWNLFDGVTYAFIRQLDNTAFKYDGLDNNLRWDNHDPDKMWYTFKNQVMTYSVATNSSTVYDTIGALPGTSLNAGNPNMYVKMSDYCNYSDDNTKAAYRLVDGNGLVYAYFSYDVANKIVRAAKDMVVDLHIPNAPLNKTPASTCVSPSGNFVYAEWNTNKNLVPNHWGTEVLDFTTMVPPAGYPLASGRITTTDTLTHSDVGLDANGDDVYVNQADQTNSADFVTFTSIRLRDGMKTKNKLPNNFYGNISAGILNNWHVSMRGAALPGWALISTFTESRNLSGDPDVPGATVPLQAEVFALKLDGSGEVRRIVHDQTTRFDYYAEAHASVNREFTKVIFGSSWRLNTAPFGCLTVTCFPLPPDSIHAFVVEIP